MILVGITGKAGSGKDSIGAVLRDSHDFALASFAYPIKKCIADLLGVDYKQWEDREWKETELPIYGCSPRHLAQTLGTQWGRRCIDQSIWINLCLEKLKWEKLGAAAITDVRFENEATAIRLEGGYIIHVHRAETDTVLTEHASERGILGADGDFHVNNFGTLEDLATQVNQIASRILELQQEALQQEEETETDEKV